MASILARNATDVDADVEAEAPAVPEEGSPQEALCKLDIRCGLIESCEKVEDSDKLFLLQVNIGDEEPRQVITGLQKFYETEELSNRKVVVYCNIKPAKLAGLPSQAMVLAGSKSKGEDDVVVEVLSPPEGVEVGTRATCGEFEVGSLSATQNPKKISKVWSKVAPLLITDDKCEVTFDGTPLLMDGKPITCKSVAKGQVS